MAVSGILSATPSVSSEGQKLKVQLVLTNPAGGSTVGILRISPYLTAANGTPAGSPGQFDFSIGSNTLLTASATTNNSLAFSWDGYAPNAPAPLNPPYPNSPAYDQVTLGAITYFTDGTTLNTSSSLYIYPLIKDTTLTLSLLPAGGTIAVPGQMFFPQNTLSGLEGVIATPAAIGAITQTLAQATPYFVANLQ